jgi:hypothetical protein
MQAIGKNVIVKREPSYASQKSDLLVTIEPEWKWIIQSVGSKVEEPIKVGDRVQVAGGKQIEVSKDIYRVPIESILAVYTA